MPGFKKLLVCLSLIVLCACATGNFSSSSFSDHSAYHYFDDFGKPLKQYEAVWEKVSSIYRGTMPSYVTIELTNNDIVSQFDTKNNRILASRRHFKTMPEEVIAHETSHLSLHRLTRGVSMMEAFRFIDEGYANIVGKTVMGSLAQYKESSICFATSECRKGSVGFEKIQKWSKYFGSPSKANWNAYLVGSSFIFYIIDTYSEEKLWEFFLDIAQTGDLSLTFTNVFRKTIAQVEDEWKRYLSEMEFKGVQTVSQGEMTQEVRYECGVCGGATAVWGNSAGCEIGAKFELTTYPTGIHSVRFFVPNSGKYDENFQVVIYGWAKGKPGKKLFNDRIVAKATQGNEWVTVDLSKLGVVVKEPFFVSMRWLTPPGKDGSSAQRIGMDLSNPRENTWVKIPGVGWKKIKDFGKSGDRTAMIRVVLFAKGQGK